MIIARGTSVTTVEYACYPAASEVLAEAARLIDQAGWSRHREVVDENDNMLPCRDKTAARFSLTGAIRRAMPDRMAGYEVLHFVEQALGETDVIGWNKYKARDKRQVIAKLRLAEKLARAAEDTTRAAAAAKAAA